MRLRVSEIDFAARDDYDDEITLAVVEPKEPSVCGVVKVKLGSVKPCTKGYEDVLTEGAREPGRNILPRQHQQESNEETFYHQRTILQLRVTAPGVIEPLDQLQTSQFTALVVG